MGPGLSMWPLPQIGLYLLMLRVRYEVACSPSGVFFLEILQVPKERFLDEFDEPEIQIRRRQDGRVLGVEALCVGRVAVKNGESADEHGADLDGLVLAKGAPLPQEIRVAPLQGRRRLPKGQG